MKPFFQLKLIPLIFTISIVLLWIGCSKNGSESVEGRVLEYGTNKPIANATVYLMEVKGTFLGPSGSSKIDSTTSDHNGRYKFTYMDNPYVSEIRGNANLYYDNYAYIMGTGKKLKTDLILDPHAWLRIHVKSNNPGNTTNSIFFEDGSCTPEGHVGKNLDTISVCQKRGNRNFKFFYSTSTSTHGNQRFPLELNLPAHDTTTVVIEF
jgi:hypothetical protein